VVNISERIKEQEGVTNAMKSGELHIWGFGCGSCSSGEKIQNPNSFGLWKRRM